MYHCMTSPMHKSACQRASASHGAVRVHLTPRGKQTKDAKSALATTTPVCRSRWGGPVCICLRSPRLQLLGPKLQQRREPDGIPANQSVRKAIATNALELFRDDELVEIIELGRRDPTGQTVKPERRCLRRSSHYRSQNAGRPQLFVQLKRRQPSLGVVVDGGRPNLGVYKGPDGLWTPHHHRHSAQPCQHSVGARRASRRRTLSGAFHQCLREPLELGFTAVRVCTDRTEPVVRIVVVRGVHSPEPMRLDCGGDVIVRLQSVSIKPAGVLWVPSRDRTDGGYCALAHVNSGQSTPPMFASIFRAGKPRAGFVNLAIRNRRIVSNTFVIGYGANLQPCVRRLVQHRPPVQREEQLCPVLTSGIDKRASAPWG